MKQSLGEMQIFADADKGVEIKYPKNWTVERPSNGLPVARFKAPYPGISISVSRQELDKPMSLKKFTDGINDLAIKDGAKHNWTVKLIESKPSSEQIDKLSTYTSIFSYDLPKPMPHSTVTQVTALKGNVGYTVLFLSVTDLHDAYSPIFKEMVASMHVKAARISDAPEGAGKLIELKGMH